MIETIISITFAVFALVSVLSVLYFSFVKVWAKTAIYDGLICLKQGQPPVVCQNLVRRRMNYLPVGSTRQIALNPAGQGYLNFFVKPGFMFRVPQSLPEALP